MTFVVIDIETVPDRARWTAPAGDPNAFPPTWAHRIVCVGWLVLDEHRAPIAHGTLADASERDILVRLARRFSAKPTLVTYNGRGFDLPVIRLRSLAHRVAQPWYFADRDYAYRYSDRMHTDLCDQLADHGAIKAMPLDAIARLIGLPGKQDVDGSDVEALVNAGRIADVERYCLDDVKQTAILWLHTLHLHGSLTDEELEARVAGIAVHFAPKEQAA